MTRQNKNVNRATLKVIAGEFNLTEKEATALSQNDADRLLEKANANIDLRARRTILDARTYENEKTMNSPLFVTACELAEIPVTRRQASKWNNKKGLAWENRFAAKAVLRKEG